MKNESLYNKTLSILIDSYFNHTLEHNNCFACAVGNIIASSCGIKLTKPGMIWAKNVPHWDSVFMTGYGSQFMYPENYSGEAKRQIDSTGYTVQELAKIEFAFETAKKGKNEEDWMFNGLMAVVEVLDDIHENNDMQVTETSKRKFQKQTA